MKVNYDSAGQLILVQTAHSTDSIAAPQTIEQLSTQSIRKLTVQEQAHLKAAFYWLNVYQPEPDASNLEQVQGCLEAFHHLCEISAWQEASSLLFTPTKSGNTQALHKQLKIWGYHLELIELYSRLIGKLNLDLDCVCLQGLGMAYRYFGQDEKARLYHEQQLEIASRIGNRLAEAQAFSGLGSTYFALEQRQTSFKCFEQQLAIAREIKDRNEEGYALGYLGA
ncbi:MAG TPA: tetratricopeptide repeat protein, partial [Oculatellaceae cyanobacterium]